MGFFNRHIEYNNREKLSAWRKISLSTWRPTGDSSVYAFEDVIVDDLLDFCTEKGFHMNTVITQALSIALHENPRVNSTIRFGKIHNRSQNGIFIHVLPKNGIDDLAGFCVTDAHKLTLTEIEKQSELSIQSIHLQEDDLSESKKIFNAFPTFWVKRLVNLLTFMMYKCNINVKALKIPENTFGSIMLTAVGSLGMQQALCPIAPYTHNSMVVSIGKIREVPLVVQGHITHARLITFGFTFDHRLIDGIQFKKFYESFSQSLKSIIK